MSTATHGLNEFPVLLRLPDLNAPVFAPQPAPVAPAAAPVPVSSPVTVALATSVVEPPATMQPPAAPTAPIATNTTAALVERSTTTALAALTALRERLPRVELSTGQWTLMRQCATGGVLVAGLALTYLLIMSSGSDETPAHIQTAETTLEPPVIVTPDVAPMPVVVPANNVVSDLGEEPAPPRFDPSWKDKVETPSHIAVVDTSVTPQPHETFYPTGASTPVPHGNDGGPGHYQGRIGPEASASVAPAYPTTDPATFIYRPMTDPRDASHVDTARLDGTIAPPPLR